MVMNYDLRGLARLIDEEGKMLSYIKNKEMGMIWHYAYN